ncbi:MAG: 50S ribosomal protein L24 [Candidatus Hydrothermarchaeota archaeon]
MKSKQPRKQRKYIYNAPKHKKRKLLSANLSEELKEKYKRRSIPIRVGDTVEIMRGDMTNMSGKVAKVDTKRFKVYIEGITIEKVDGTKRLIPIHPSNLRITKLNLDDEERENILQRGSKIG